MTSIITCQACHYTRHPTDDAPEWACPQCQMAYNKTACMTTHQHCKNHPSEKASWRCNDCWIEFCAACVTPHQHSMSHLSRSIPFATCPECKGMCIDFMHEEKIVSDQLAADKANKRRALKLLGAVTIATVLLIIFLLWAPFELRMLFMLTWVVVMLVLSALGGIDDILNLVIGGFFDYGSFGGGDDGNDDDSSSDY